MTQENNVFKLSKPVRDEGIIVGKDKLHTSLLDALNRAHPDALHSEYLQKQGGNNVKKRMGAPLKLTDEEIAYIRALRGRAHLTLDRIATALFTKYGKKVSLPTILKWSKQPE